MPRKLKVFRTSTGFHDAYVAATSRKAALAAWGAEADLFARGVAEEVTDPKLTAAPLKKPGEVVKVSRGDLAAQLKALGPRKTRKPKAEAKGAPERSRPARAKPPPKRDKVDRAEAELEAARQRHAAAEQELEDARDAIEAKLEALRTKHGREQAKLERARDAAREAYRSAIETWSDG